jgi:hypothetical protein
MDLHPVSHENREHWYATNVEADFAFAPAENLNGSSMYLYTIQKLATAQL